MFPCDKQSGCKQSRDLSNSQSHERPSGVKRRKVTSHDYPPEFWDALSEIVLTRKSLNELDRRTARRGPPITSKRTGRWLRSYTRRLAVFVRNGGPDLGNLRGYAAQREGIADMSKPSSRLGKRTRDSGLPSSEPTNKTITTGPYDPHFKRACAEVGVFTDELRLEGGARPPKPRNLDELRQKLSQARPSLSPSAFSEGAFEHFQDMNGKAKSESKAMSVLIPIIAGAKDSLCETEENKSFNKLEKFAPSLTKPQPDKYYGERTERIDPRVRAKLGHYIIPCTDESLPAAPNFFLVAKSAGARSDVAQWQAMYDGAIGARAMLHLQNYGNSQLQYDGNAYSSASTYNPGSGTLQIYATHPKQSATKGTEYYMTQLRSFAMTDSADSFRQGAAAYRNMRDLTARQRASFVGAANATARHESATVSAPAPGAGSTTSTSLAIASFGSNPPSDELGKYSSDESGSDVRPRKRVYRATAAARRSSASAYASSSKARTSSRRTQRRHGRPRDDESHNDDAGADENRDDENDDDYLGVEYRRRQWCSMM